MAKSARHRPMPRIPVERPAPPPTNDLGVAEAGPRAAEPAPIAQPAPTDRGARSRGLAPESPHVLAGTGCTSGHERGHELDAGRLGMLPNRNRARIGFGLVLWCVGGMALLAAAGIASWTWSSWGSQVALLWLAFAAYVVRRAGHRRRCWRTRTWRHAWGGLAPGSS